MCGRFSLGADTDRLIQEFGPSVGALDAAPRFNIAPTQAVAAVVRAPEGLRAGSLRWGLASGDGAAKSRAPMINARAETVATRSAFAASFRRRRCWILADGFYEWGPAADGSRVPFHISLPDGRPFAFAGLWDRRGREGEGLATCAILTTESTPPLSRLHNRMPLILPADTRDRWLDPAASPADLAPLLRPFVGELRIRQVSTRVNSVANDDPACAEPVTSSP